MLPPYIKVSQQLDLQVLPNLPAYFSQQSSHIALWSNYFKMRFDECLSQLFLSKAFFLNTVETPLLNWGTGSSKSELLLVALHILKALYYMQKADYWRKKLKTHCIKWWHREIWAPRICFIGSGCFVSVQNKGNSPSNRLELLAVLRGSQGSEN